MGDQPPSRIMAPTSEVETTRPKEDSCQISMAKMAKSCSCLHLPAEVQVEARANPREK